MAFNGASAAASSPRNDFVTQVLASIGRFFLIQLRNDRGLTRHDMRSILIRKGVILNFLGFLKVIGPIVSVSSVQP
jgi:hypothetical protein